nr:response regulator [Oscillospiraceae bacterium]
ICKPLFKSTLYSGINCYRNPTMKPVETKKQEVKFHGEKILLAEDNELNTEIAVAILEDVGLQVDTVENGRLCVEKFSASAPNYYSAILMDVRMPVLNGHDATREIRKLDREDRDLPIIAMTADAFAEDVAKAKECGMNAHIAKPIDVNTLFYVLQRELDRSGQNSATGSDPK